MRRLLALAVLLTLALPAAAAAVEPEGSVWSEAYITSDERSDGGPQLHADIMRPEGLVDEDGTPNGVRTPVLLVVSPYTNHSGGPADPDLDERPSSRFNDFVEEAGLMERGYTYVIVDLRGTGGSDGCNDWGGPGEQADVREAVEWAARQEWSNGRVGLYGKSYDGWTGLMALAQRPQGLAAVISQEPVVDGYRYLYMNRVPFSNRLGTPALFQVIDFQPGHPQDDPQYHVSSLPKDPACYLTNVNDQQNPDPESEFWKPRNLVDAVKGSTTPTFLMAGFLEDNTKPDHVWALFNNLSGTENRGWFGQWDHIRGTDRGIDDADAEFFEKPLAGREGFAAEAARFLDVHVKGVPRADVPADPKLVVQSNDGSFREEQAWPPADVERLETDLLGGAYVDDGGNDGTGSGAGNGLWTFSPPLARRAHLAGAPTVALDLTTSAPDANLVANVYDVAPDGQATMVSRGAFLVADTGSHAFELYAQDWRFEPGHRIGVLLSDANDEWFDHAASDAEVTVNAASIELPFLPVARTSDLDGVRSLKLRDYLEDAPFTVEAQIIAERTAAGFAVPQEPAPASEPTPPGGGNQGGGGPGGSTAPPVTTPAPGAGRARLEVRLRARRVRRGVRRIVVSGRAPAGARVTVVLRRAGRMHRVKRVSAGDGRYRVRFSTRRGGRFRAVATTRQGTERLVARSRARDLRSPRPRAPRRR